MNTSDWSGKRRAVKPFFVRLLESFVLKTEKRPYSQAVKGQTFKSSTSLPLKGNSINPLSQRWNIYTC